MKKKYMKYYLVFLLVFTVVFASFARFRTTLGNENHAKIATPVINLNTDDSSILIMMDPTNPHDSQNFYFEVSNKNDNDKISDVTLNYTLELEKFDNLPLEYKLYSYNKDTSKYDIEVSMSDYKTEEELLIKENEQNDLYMLNIKWQDNIDSYVYSKTIDYIKVIATAEQAN